MKTNPILALCTCMSVMAISCQKEISSNQNIVSTPTQSNAVVATPGSWQGYFSAAGHENVYVADTTFIQNGYARLTENPYPDFSTTFNLEIPSDKNLNGDTLLLKVRLRNPDSTKGSVYPYTVTIITDCADDSIRMQTSALPELSLIGSSRSSYWEESFNRVIDKWSKIIIKSTPARFSGHFANEPILGVLGHYPFGRLERLTFSFKGSGAIDFVKLEGYSGKLLMEENFDGLGSNVIWYE